VAYRITVQDDGLHGQRRQRWSLASLLTAARTAEWGGCSGYYADSDGYPWEVAWNPGSPLAADGSVQVR